MHTQNIENLWIRMKSRIRGLNGTRKELYSSYFAEFMMRQSLKMKFCFQLC